MKLNYDNVSNNIWPLPSISISYNMTNHNPKKYQNHKIPAKNLFNSGNISNIFILSSNLSAIKFLSLLPWVV